MIPDEAEMEYTIRAGGLGDLTALRKKIYACFNGAAQATGTSVDIKELSPTVDALMPNFTMGKIFRNYGEQLGMFFIQFFYFFARKRITLKV